MFRMLLVLSLVSSVAPHAVQAQQDTTGLVPGRRIRVHQQDHKKLVGSFVAMDSASRAMVTNAGDTVRVPLGHIVGLDLSQGTKSNAGKGALTGLLIGAMSGVLVGAVASSSDDGDFIDLNAGEWAVGIGAVFGALGAGIGAGVGAGQRSDKWAPAVWPTLTLLPGGANGKRIALGLHLTF